MVSVPTSGASPLINRRTLPPLIALVLIALGVMVIVASLHQTPASTGPASTAVTYAAKQMVWTQGPTADSTHLVQMSDLQAALNRYAPTIGNHVPVKDLISQYGLTRQVAVVVLTGSFNSLPPDEGVTLHRAVVIVDVRANKGLLVTD